MAQLKIKNKDGSFSELATKEYGDKRWGQTYMSDECWIGTWMGKNLYRRVLYLPKGLNGITTEQEILLSDEYGFTDDVDTIWIGSGSYFTQFNKIAMPFNWYYTDEWKATASVAYMDDWYGVVAKLWLGHENLAYGECVLVFEYTKKAENDTYTFRVGNWTYRSDSSIRKWGQWLESDYNIHGFSTETHNDIEYIVANGPHGGFIKTTIGAYGTYIDSTNWLDDDDEYQLVSTIPSGGGSN